MLIPSRSRGRTGVGGCLLVLGGISMGEANEVEYRRVEMTSPLNRDLDTALGRLRGWVVEGGYPCRGGLLSGLASWCKSQDYSRGPGA